MTSTDEHEITLRSIVDEGCNGSTANNVKLIKLASKAPEKQSQKLNSSSEFILLEGTDALIEMLKKKKRTHVCKTIDCNDISQAKQLIRLFPNPEPKSKVGVTDTRLTVILDPKFHPPSAKMDENTSPLTSYLSDCNSRCNEEASVENNVGKNNTSSSISYFGRNICDTVKDLMKDLIVTKSNAKDGYGPEVEWITVSSFIKKLNSLPTTSRDDDSNITNEEVEVTNEILEEQKYSKKDDVHSDVQKMLNDLVLGKILNSTLTNSPTHSVKSQVKSSKESLSVMAKREREINEIMNPQANEYFSSQNLLSNSSNNIKENKSHGKCLKYFIEAMIRKTDCPSARIYRYEDSQSTCNYKNSKASAAKNKHKRKPMNLHKYLNDNFIDTETYYASKEVKKMFFVLPKMLKSPRPKIQRS